MSEISKRFEKLLAAYFHKQDTPFLIPKKTPNGILVGQVLISSRGTLKDIIYEGHILYKSVSLNEAAIAIATAIAVKGNSLKVNEIYKADQLYGKWLDDWMLMKEQMKKAIQKKDYQRADILESRLLDCRLRADHAKRTTLSLITSK